MPPPRPLRTALKLSLYAAQAFQTPLSRRGFATSNLWLWICLWQSGWASTRLLRLSPPPSDRQTMWWSCHLVSWVIFWPQTGHVPPCSFQRASKSARPCIAFTIRAWSRRTSRWTARQSMAHQSTSRWVTAPAGIPAVICFVSLIGLPSSLVKKDQVEVCSLSRRMMLPEDAIPILPITGRHLSCTDKYRAFAFSTLPYPQPYRLALRLAFPSSSLPSGRAMGLPRSTLKPSNGLGSAYSPVARRLR